MRTCCCCRCSIILCCCCVINSSCCFCCWRNMEVVSMPAIVVPPGGTKSVAVDLKTGSSLWCLRSFFSRIIQFSTWLLTLLLFLNSLCISSAHLIKILLYLNQSYLKSIVQSILMYVYLFFGMFSTTFISSRARVKSRAPCTGELVTAALSASGVLGLPEQ